MLKEIIIYRDNIRTKLAALKQAREGNEDFFKNIVIEPIRKELSKNEQTIVKKQEKEVKTEKTEVERDIHPEQEREVEEEVFLEEEENQPLSFPDYLTTVQGKVDTTSYGPRRTSSPHVYKLGLAEISLNGNTLNVSKKQHEENFPATRGLLGLIFLKEPSDYSNQDLQAYKQIIRYTKLHYCKSGESTRLNRRYDLYKYKEIISKLTELKGGGLIFKNTNEKDFLYYHDYNELVSRLKTLYGERLAGHTGTRNEFMQLLNVLIEKRVIRETPRSKMIIDQAFDMGQ